MLHPAAKLFADCTQAELLEHAIARLEAIHGERGVIADYLRARLQALESEAQAQGRAGRTRTLPRVRIRAH